MGQKASSSIVLEFGDDYCVLSFNIAIELLQFDVFLAAVREKCGLEPTDAVNLSWFDLDSGITESVSGYHCWELVQGSAKLHPSRPLIFRVEESEVNDSDGGDGVHPIGPLNAPNITADQAFELSIHSNCQRVNDLNATIGNVEAIVRRIRTFIEFDARLKRHATRVSFAFCSSASGERRRQFHTEPNPMVIERLTSDGFQVTWFKDQIVTGNNSTTEDFGYHISWAHKARSPEVATQTERVTTQ